MMIKQFISRKKKGGGGGAVVRRSVGQITSGKVEKKKRTNKKQNKTKLYIQSIEVIHRIFKFSP